MEQKLEHSLDTVVAGLPDALWLRDARTGAFLYCSPACEAVWGVPVGQLSQRPASWLELLHPEDRPQVRHALSRAFVEGGFDQQYRIVLPDGRLKWIHDRGSLLRSAAGLPERLAGLARDITDFKTLETEVRKAFDALHSSADGIIITDQNGLITYANPAFLSLFRFEDVSRAIGAYAEDLFASDDIEELFDPHRESGEPARRTREFVLNRQDGSRVFVEVSASKVHDAQGNVVGDMASFLDVTERKERETEARRQHARLRRLAERMADLEERERRRISDLIHDTAVQSLSLSNIRLGAVRKALTEAGLERATEQLDAAREMVGEGIRQCRLIMSDLTPPLLYELGLGPALRQLAERMQKLQGIAINVEDAAPAPAVPEKIRGLLFQAARELVLNACKHATPSRVDIVLTASNQHLEIVVRDDGRGFDPKPAGNRAENDSGGFGLFSIRQRLERAGGRLDIDSTPGRGTVARIRIRI